ncbi:TonB-dependent receptor domain-containing protein [Sphingosinicella sp.]|uniref:TonB-dependent receptor domain-containing protein n=1 Tax=Sphingosinicella sp. TaxID=1917971 RepID=UPI0040376563
MRNLGLLGSSALRSGAMFALALGAAAPAFAEETAAAATAADEVATQGDATAEQSDPAIVVTGSRIRRPNLDSTIPITSVDAQQLTEQANVSLGDALNDLPALRSTFSQANSTRFIGTAGINLLDLRGLGTARTLVLVNGRRHVTSSPGTFDVDVNTIPADLLERVDIVTGGNSAVYGSDAVTGVVNFILRTDYEGVALRAQSGITSYGDRRSYFISGVWGRNFLDNTLNVAVAVEYARQAPLFHGDRPEMTGVYTGVPGFSTVESTVGELPAGDGVPDTRFFQGPPGITFGSISLSGAVLTACPLANPASALVTARRAAVCTGLRTPTAAGPNTGTELSDAWFFQPDGTIIRNNPALDLRQFGGSQFGGQGASGVEGAQLAPGFERFAVNLLVNADIAPWIRPFAEFKYVWITANQTSTQPTFINSTLSPTFRTDNPFLSAQARSAINTITGNPQGSIHNFSFNRFNNDIGTRAEDHERNTFRGVFGVRGEISTTGNWNYEVAVNYGRTETFYETGGNVNVARFNRAADAAPGPGGSIQCRVNVDADPNNNDPLCRPINLFGFGAPATTPDGLAYVLYVSSREQWAEQLNATAFISGDTSGWFELPGGPIGLVFGVEYRREDAFSDFDDFTQSGATFLNAISEFDPPAIDVREAFGEIRIPILRDMPFFHELSLEGAARYSDYSSTGGVWAYNIGLIWSPVRDLRLRGGYARSVRAPNLGDLFATRSETFANGLLDPCSQSQILQGPNRVQRCAEAGIPTTLVVDGITVPWNNTPQSGVSGFNQGNLDLQPERGTSWTVGAVIQPRWVPGLSISLDYYNIEIRDAIAGLTGQAIINRCYEDPVSLANPFCDAVFRRRTPGDTFRDFTFDGQNDRVIGGSVGVITMPRLGPGFLNQPFNYQSLKTSGVDADISYRRQILPGVTMNLRALVSWVDQRVQFTFIADPARSVRLHGTLGDPIWAASLTAGLDFGEIDIAWNGNYIGEQTVDAWETMFSHQGRAPTNADLRSPEEARHPDALYHAVRIGFEPAGTRHRIYFGVDNLLDRNPSFGLDGTGGGGAIFPNTGRFFYAGAQIRF